MPGEFYLLEVLRVLWGQDGHQGRSFLPLEGSRSIPGICCGIPQAKPLFHYFFRLFPLPDNDKEPKFPVSGPFSTPISEGKPGETLQASQRWEHQEREGNSGNCRVEQGRSGTAESVVNPAVQSSQAGKLNQLLT